MCFELENGTEFPLEPIDKIHMQCSLTKYDNFFLFFFKADLVLLLSFIDVLMSAIDHRSKTKTSVRLIEFTLSPRNY